PHNAVSWMSMNHTKPPFNDANVRKAVRLAIDYQDLQTRVFEGTGYPGAILDPRIYPSAAIPEAELKQYPGIRQPKDQDIAEAKRLLAAAGYGAGLDIGECSTSDGGFYPEFSSVVVQQLKRVGITCVLKTYENAATLAKSQKGEYTFLTGWSYGVLIVEPQFLWETVWSKNAAGNYLKYEDTVLEDLLKQLTFETDPAKRDAINLKMQRRILEQNDHPNITPEWNDWVNVIGSKVKGYTPGYAPFDNHRHDTTWLEQ
ncbi:MAG: hypothetical protein HY531_01340, partial [Chloroflexi bacterium]|nr:hypothetical protein [Chloroflexota bacterium]